MQQIQKAMRLKMLLRMPRHQRWGRQNMTAEAPAEEAPIAVEAPADVKPSPQPSPDSSSNYSESAGVSVQHYIQPGRDKPANLIINQCRPQHQHDIYDPTKRRRASLT